MELMTTAQGQYIKTAQVSDVGHAAAELIVAENSARKSIVITNTGSKTMFIGPAAVTAATGKRLKTDESITLDRSQAAIYGICAGADHTTADYIEE